MSDVMWLFVLMSAMSICYAVGVEVGRGRR